MHLAHYQSHTLFFYWLNGRRFNGVSIVCAVSYGTHKISLTGWIKYLLPTFRTYQPTMATKTENHTNYFGNSLNFFFFFYYAVKILPQLNHSLIIFSRLRCLQHSQYIKNVPLCNNITVWITFHFIIFSGDCSVCSQESSISSLHLSSLGRLAFPTD